MTLIPAHGLGGTSNLPIPIYVFAWGAALVLLASFFALTRLWSEPRLQRPAERAVLGLPRAMEPLCGAIGVGLFAFLVFAGFAGTQDDPAHNALPVFVYVFFWVGLAILSALFGDIFRAFNPWRAIARAAAWATHRRRGPVEPLRPYPGWLGRWPAAFGILAFAWLELAAPVHLRTDPALLSALALLYAAVQLVAMRIWGIEAWTRSGDAFAAYFDLFARLAPLRWTPRALMLRKPLAGVTGLMEAPGTVALLVVMIGTTSFDGFSRGSIWTTTLPFWAPELEAVHLGEEAAIAVLNTLAMLVLVLAVAWIYRLGTIGMHTIERRRSTGYLSRRFAQSLVPIALAYVVAHYLAYYAQEGQALVYLLSDPLGSGADLFGTASFEPNPNVLRGNAFWYIQVAALLAGHIAGLMLAHDRALVIYRRAASAARSQQWMLVVMVGFTCSGLWLLSESA